MMHELAQQFNLSTVAPTQATQATQGVAQQQQKELFTAELATLVDTERQALESLRAVQRSTQQAAQQAASDAKSKLDNYQSHLEGKQEQLRACERVHCLCIVIANESFCALGFINNKIPVLQIGRAHIIVISCTLTIQM